MIHHFDHRFATYEPDGSTRYPTVAEKQAASFAVLPRYWVAESEVNPRVAGRGEQDWLLGYRWVTNPTNERTLLCSATPLTAAGNSEPLIFARQAQRLGSVLSSFAADYVARQMLGGQNMTFSTTQQLAVLEPSRFDDTVPWQSNSTLQVWFNPRELELGFNSSDMRTFAHDLGDSQQPFRWDEQRRSLLRAELDAAYFHLYGVVRDDVDYILDTFPIVRRKDEAAHGEYRTKRLILEIYDAMATAIAKGEPYQTVLDPPPGQGARHDEQVLSR